MEYTKDNVVGIIYRNKANNIYRVIGVTPSLTLDLELLKNFGSKKVLRVMEDNIAIYNLANKTILFNPYEVSKLSFHTLFPFNL
jgi:hypothetical protein